MANIILLICMYIFVYTGTHYNWTDHCALQLSAATAAPKDIIFRQEENEFPPHATTLPENPFPAPPPCG